MQVDRLERTANARDIRNALLNLPTTLDEVYERTIARIQEGPLRKRALDVLNWVSYAKGPLKLQELSHALAVEPEDTFFDEEGLIERDLLLTMCAGLVLIDERSSLVRLVHSTLQEYLEIFGERYFQEPELIISQTCLTYMAFDKFNEGPCGSNEALNGRLREYPFLEYAAQHWADHTRGSMENRLEDEILEFLDSEVKASCAIQVLLFSTLYGEKAWNAFPKGLTALHIAAFCGLTSIVARLIEREADMSAHSLDGWTALHCAASNGHSAAVRLLLDKGANVAAQDAHKWTPLHWATFKGHKGAVEELLEGGADTAVQAAGGQTALYLATSARDEPMVRLLLEKGSDAAAQDIRGRTSLQEALGNSCKGISKPLLVKAAEIADQNDEDPFPGEISSHMEDLQTMWVKSLAIQRVRSLFIDDDFVEFWHRRDFATRLLHNAARKGDEHLARLLLDKWIDVTDSDNRREVLVAALVLGACNGHEAVVRLLLEQDGVDPDATFNNFATPLACAARNGHEAVVRLLLEAKADVRAEDSPGRTALYWAARKGHEAVVRLLLDAKPGVDGDGDDEQGSYITEALNCAGFKLFFQVMHLLIELKAGADETDLSNISVRLAGFGGAVLQQLLEADVDAKDSNTGTVVYGASEGLLAVVLLLCKADRGFKGADFAEKMAYADFPINDDIPMIINILRSIGIDLDQTDEHGWPPRLLASVMGLAGIFPEGTTPITETKILQPTSWSETDKSDVLEVDEDNLSVRYSGERTSTPLFLKANRYSFPK